MKRPKPLSTADQHALAAFFALHHAAHVVSTRPTGERNVERTVMATFGLVEKKGPYRLTPRGKRVVKLAQTDI